MLTILWDFLCVWQLPPKIESRAIWDCHKNVLTELEWIRPLGEQHESWARLIADHKQFRFFCHTLEIFPCNKTRVIDELQYKWGKKCSIQSTPAAADVYLLTSSQKNNAKAFKPPHNSNIFYITVQNNAELERGRSMAESPREIFSSNWKSRQSEYFISWS